MITTLTLNPSLDRTYSVDRLTRGAVHRMEPVATEAGGKGVNVARALMDHGVDAIAIVPVGGSNGSELVRLAKQVGLNVVGVPIAGSVRANVSIVEPDGTTTKLNEPGPLLSTAELDSLLAATVGACTSDAWVVASGSLPPGAPEGTYADLAARVIEKGARIAVDTSGPALTACVPARPTLLKPNLEELRELTAKDLATLGDAVEACQDLLEVGVEQVLLSLGADGAVLVNEKSAIHGAVTPTSVRNTVGAGDALLSGYLAGGGSGSEALATALVWARAAVRSPGTTMAEVNQDDWSAVEIHDAMKLDLPLTSEYGGVS